MPDRFQLSEVEGFLTPRAGGYRAAFGLTVAVHDVAYLSRAVAVFRSEDYSGGRSPGGATRTVAVSRQLARDAAQAECDRLNAKHGPYPSEAA